MKKSSKTRRKSLKHFKSGNNITALQEQKSVLLKQIAEIETELAKTQGELNENAGRIRALKSHQSTGSEPGSMGQETDFNPLSMSIHQEQGFRAEAAGGKAPGQLQRAEHTGGEDPAGNRAGKTAP